MVAAGDGEVQRSRTVAITCLEKARRRCLRPERSEQRAQYLQVSVRSGPVHRSSTPGVTHVRITAPEEE